MNNQPPAIERRQRHVRHGFTLVEVLVVIVIIGILAGITVPAVAIAMRTARQTAIRTEIDVLSQALEAYRLEYGSYPPDFYSWNQVERHFRKAFPNIDDNELRILAQFTHCDNMLVRGGSADPRTDTNYDHYPHAIDRAEALVFCLGGFSSDKRRPFTGPGGPLVKRTDAGSPSAIDLSSEPDGDGNDYLAFQYNTDRETGQFEFESGLSLVLIDDGNVNAFTYSNDEDPKIDGPADMTVAHSSNVLGIRYYPDPFPTFRSGKSELPVAYFNSSNYDRAWGIAASNAVWYGGFSHHSQNVLLPESDDIGDTGIARPYATDIRDTTPPASIGGFPVTRPVFQFAEAETYQLISAGLDSNYGGLIGGSGSWGSASEVGIGLYPSGLVYNPVASINGRPLPIDKYQEDYYLEQLGLDPIYGVQPQMDNITNFCSKTLESDLK